MRRDEILSALTALGAELAERGLIADLYVVGGATSTLAYDERRAIKDIDAVFVPKRRGTMDDLTHAVWRKSSRSGAGNECVEVAQPRSTGECRLLIVS